jgi:hypothetical protein
MAAANGHSLGEFDYPKAAIPENPVISVAFADCSGSKQNFPKLHSTPAALNHISLTTKKPSKGLFLLLAENQAP